MAAGITQIARPRQPCAAASAFIASEIPMHAAFSTRGRSARLPCNASATPRDAKITAPASGIPASTAATARACLTASTITYCACQLTAAAATASRGQHQGRAPQPPASLTGARSEEHTSELQSQFHLVCRLLLEKKKK